MEDSGKKALSTLVVIVSLVAVLVRCVGAAERIQESREAPARGTYVATAIIGPLQQICRDHGGIPSGPLNGLCTYPGTNSSLSGCAIERVRFTRAAATPTRPASPNPAATATRSATARVTAAPSSPVTLKFGFPNALAIDQGGNFYVADTLLDIVFKVAPDGTRLDGWHVSRPTDIALDSAGNLFISDDLNDCFHLIRADGTIRSTWDGSAGTPKLTGPNGIAIAADGSLAIAETETGRIQRITPSGTDLGAITLTGSEPTDIVAETGGGFAVIDQKNQRILQLAPDGTTRATIDGPATGQRFRDLNAIAISPSGDLLVVDGSANQIYVIGPDGAVVRSYSERTYEIDGIVSDATGQIYVADSTTHRVYGLR